jgi:two-component system sensor histidine kinase RpfC
VTMTTFLMLYGGEYTTPLFVIYLWITFGCGFRFGARYLIISLAISSVGFITVLAAGNYWLDKRTLGIGLLFGMVALSLYVLVLIRRLYEALDRAAANHQAP